MRAEHETDPTQTFNTVFDRGLATSDLLNSRDCLWWDSLLYKKAYCKSFSLVDEHSQYTASDPNKFYYRKDISPTNFEISVESSQTGSAPWTVWADNNYFSIIPTIQSKDLTFDVHASIPATGSTITDSEFVRLYIKYLTPNEKDLYTSTTGGAAIDSANFEIIFRFHTV
jgi:hypothetical protein